MKFRHKIILISHVLVLFSTISGYYIALVYNFPWVPPNNVPELSAIDLFLNNIRVMGFLAVISLLGPVGLFLTLFLAFETGMGIARVIEFYQIPIGKFLIGLLPHGIGEFIVLGLINSHSLIITTSWINYFRDKNTRHPKKFVMREINFIVNTLLAALPILLISAYIEINFSRSYFVELLIGGGLD